MSLEIKDPRYTVRKVALRQGPINAKATRPAVPKSSFAAETATAQQASPRFTQLDALRGIAALTVVFCHFANMWLAGNSTLRDNKFLSLALSPFIAGREAVLLFFLLSGFVLSLPYLRGKGQTYSTFIARRLLRIYAPYLFALALAVAGNAIWHGPLHHGWWAAETWSKPVNGMLVLKHILFIGNYPRAAYNTAFWSLVIEMRVSIIFPILVLFVRPPRIFASTVLAFCLFVFAPVWAHSRSNLGIVGNLEAIAIFIVGIIFARHIAAVNLWIRGLSTLRQMALACASLALYFFGRVSGELFGSFGAADILIIGGAVGIMAAAINAPLAIRFLDSRGPRFLGRISYSLYLVHGTVLFALTYALAGKLSGPAQLPIYLGLSIVVATVFCIWIEEPFMRLSKRVGKRPVATTSQLPLAA